MPPAAGALGSRRRRRAPLRRLWACRRGGAGRLARAAVGSVDAAGGAQEAGACRQRTHPCKLRAAVAAAHALGELRAVVAGHAATRRLHHLEGVGLGAVRVPLRVRDARVLHHCRDAREGGAARDAGSAGSRQGGSEGGIHALLEEGEVLGGGCWYFSGGGHSSWEVNIHSFVNGAEAPRRL